MLCVSLQRKTSKFQEESSDLEAQLLELGFLCENNDVADPDTLLELETFTTVSAYDALNRATSIKTPHNASIPASEILPAYNEASLLESVNVKLRGSSTATNFVQNIDYDAKGQRERIQYGNGSTTGYTYDENTFRLKRLLTTRNNGADVLQDLNYTYDAAGNVTQIDDSAQQTIFFNGSVVSPSQKFEYDALYRLVKATGREHVSVNADSEPEADGYNQAQISPQDGTAMRNYAREWEYDGVGNILSIIHNANGNAWTRTNAYATDSNRLTGTSVGQTTANFAYNAHGSMASMPHLNVMDWDFAEKLCHITRGTTEAYYSYDGNGIRTRKVVEKNGTVETRLYLGGFEIWRKTVNGTLETERETLHVMDDQRRIAIVETLTVENGNRAATPVPVQRYQLDNHLGSASLELDDSANIISYEEYYPYGDTSYRAGSSASEVSQKRYRYTGKEKDEESSLYYCEQRYYAAHISRWISTDPTWLEDGINLYAYVNGNPVSGVDPSGTETENLNYKYEAYPKPDEVDNQPMVFRNGNRRNEGKKEKQMSVENESQLNASAEEIELINAKMPQILQSHYKKEIIKKFGSLKNFKAYTDKLTCRHLEMVLKNNDPKEHKEISAIGNDLNKIYIGYYDEGRKRHTMGQEFGNILKDSTESFKQNKMNSGKSMFVFHLHPASAPDPSNLNIQDASMFSPGDHLNMDSLSIQIWIGIKVQKKENGKYFYEIHASEKDLYNIFGRMKSVPLDTFNINVDKCAPVLFRKEIQMNPIIK